MTTAVLIALLSASPGFQSPLGFRFTPPEGFTLIPDLPAGSTRAVAPAPPEAKVQLLAAFQNEADDPSTLAIALVGAPLELDRSSPERVAALAIDYLHDVLGADLHIEWIERLPAAGSEALELAGRITIDDDDGGETERIAQFAFLPFGKKQIVVTASLPAARFATLGPEVEKAVAGLTFDRPAQPSSNRAEIGAAVGGLLGLAVAMTRLLWRRRGVS